MKLNKTAALVLAMTLTVSLLSACSGSSAPATGSSAFPSEQSSSAAPASSSVALQASPRIETVFFDAEILSTELVKEYDGKVPTEGGIFLKVAIRVVNTLGQEILMFDTDFQAKWGVNSGALPLEASNDEMAPMEYTLQPGGGATYFYIYEIPTGVEDILIVFQEEFEDGETGELYTLPVELESMA